ncbi:pilus assembly protein [Pseudomonas nitroreducens]|uniref:pilus assembly protein n=1 Tax=Pseudomonas nitroreducens TaxID=46680 RepID=UPI00351D015D
MKSRCNARFIWRVIAFSVLGVAQFTARAEDIDLFVGTPPNATAAPNVLIILDNTANWEQPFVNEKKALVDLIGALDPNKYRVGLMMFTETGSTTTTTTKSNGNGGGNSGGGSTGGGSTGGTKDDNKGEDGGYVRAAIRLLDATTKPKYQALVNSLDILNDKSNGGKASLAMEEAWLYYSSGVPYAGNQKAKTDYTGNMAGSTASNAIYALAGNALPSKDGSPYNSPIVEGCAKNFIIYISNGAPKEDSNSIKHTTAALAAAKGNTTAIPISPTSSQDSMVDEWSRFMKKSSLGVTTYTVDIDKRDDLQGRGWSAALQSMATVSSGEYFDVSSGSNGQDIVNALKSIFSKIQETNSVFASVTLPVSVNAQSTYLNQVFVGMFRPDPNALPRWAGNLKQYKLGMVKGVLKTVDARDKDAINSSTGFITECARSYWTPLAQDTYWESRPQGTCTDAANMDVSNSPDGNIVEKGAQAYLLRQGGTRTMKTCDPSGCTSLTNFDTNNGAVTQALLGAANSSERDNLINWALGANNIRNDGDEIKDATQIRPSVHGDVVHSRPAAINYGDATSPNVVVYYGGNDGVLRAVNGNRNGGDELWSFMPPEFYPRIKRIRDNDVTISFPGNTATSPVPQPKYYGMDGSVTSVQQGGRTWIYATMRRGGRAIYAFDVTTPASPSLKWKRGCDSAGCSTGFSDIGQTWATPTAVKAAGYNSGTATILAMGGGYDTCEDTDPNNCTSTSKGKGIYLLDADTGARLNTLATLRGVVGDVAWLTDDNGMASYGYAADLGGNVYRISGPVSTTTGASAIGNTDPANWAITRIAALGCDSASSCNANRKFMYGPEVAVTNGEYVIVLGSGDREKPILSYSSAITVANRFYSLRDKPSDPTWLSVENTTCSGEVICNASLLAITTTATPSTSDLTNHPKGWYLALAAKEQVVTSALLLFDTIIFSTHQPTEASATSCANLGIARNYNINYKNAAGSNGDRFSVIAGGGLAPSPVAGIVILDDGTQKPFVIGGGNCASDSSLQGCEAVPPASGIRPKSWVYWNIER